MVNYWTERETISKYISDFSSVSNRRKLVALEKKIGDIINVWRKEETLRVKIFLIKMGEGI